MNDKDGRKSIEDILNMSHNDRVKNSEEAMERLLGTPSALMAEALTIAGIAKVGMAAMEVYPTISDTRPRAYLAAMICLRTALELAKCYDLGKQFTEAYIDFEKNLFECFPDGGKPKKEEK